MDPDPWLCPGHESIRDILEHPPRSARKCDKDRVMAILGCPTGSIMFSLHFFTKWLQDNQLRSRTQVLSAAQDHEPALLHVCKYQSERRIDFALEMLAAKDQLEQESKSSWDLCSASTTTPCSCSGRWLPLRESMPSLQEAAWAGDDPQEPPTVASVRAALAKCLREGRAKYKNVFVYGPRNSAKSHLLDPIDAHANLQK